MSEERDTLIRYRMERARETLTEADLMAQTGHWNACVNRLYYACFSAVKHTGVRSLLNRHFVRTGIIDKTLGALYQDLFEGRQQGDYYDLVRFEEQQVRPWITEAQRFVTQIDALLQPPSIETGDT